MSEVVPCTPSPVEPVWFTQIAAAIDVVLGAAILSRQGRFRRPMVDHRFWRLRSVGANMVRREDGIVVEASWLQHVMRKNRSKTRRGRRKGAKARVSSKGRVSVDKPRWSVASYEIDRTSKVALALGAQGVGAEIAAWLLKLNDEV